MDHVNPVLTPEAVESRYSRAHRERAGPNDERVVSDNAMVSARIDDVDLVSRGIDALGDGPEMKAHARRLEIRCRAVGQVAPIGYLTRDVVGNATDREIRILVGDQDGDVRTRIELASAERGTDARIAPADRHEAHR
jgi:hypothetical protein